MSLDDLEETPDHSAEAGPNRRKSKRRFRRRWIPIGLGILLILGILFLVVLAGPGFRLLVPIAAGKWAKTQGLVSEVEIDGSLWSGFTLRNVSFEPENPDEPFENDSGIVSLSLGEASLSYRLLDLIRSPGELNWLDRVHLESLDLTLHLPEPDDAKPPSEKEPKPKAPRDDFHPLWNLLDAEIVISDVAVNIEQGDTITKVAGFRLESPSENAGVVALESISLPGRDPLSDFSVPIRKGDHSISLGPIELPPAGTIENVTLAEPSPTVFTFSLGALVAGGELNVEFDENQNIRGSLARGTKIDLTKIFPERSEELPLRGTITDFDFRFSHPLDAPNQWELGGQLVGNGVGWKNLTFDTLALAFQRNGVSLDLLRPGTEISARASLPLENATTTEEISSLPLDASAKVSAPDIAALLAEAELDLPVTGGLQLSATNLQFDFSGNAQSGNVNIETTNLGYDGLAVPILQVVAHVTEPNAIELQAQVGVDDVTRISAKANFLRDSLSYSGTAKANIDTGGTLGGWLKEKFDLDLAGAATLNWSGAGDIDEPTHSGDSTIALTGLTLAGKPPIDAAIDLGYRGTDVDLSRLEVKAGPLEMAGTGRWDGKLIELPDWTIRHDEADRITLVASVPFDPKAEGGFLGQDTPVSVDLVFNQLGIDRVLALVTEDPPVSGELNGNLSVDGSFRALDAKGQLAFAPALEEIGDDASIGLDLAFSGDVSVPRSWNLNLDTDVDGLVFREVELGTVDLALKTDRATGRNLVHGDLAFDHAGTTLDAKIRTDLTESDTLESLANLPLDADLDLVVESIASLLRDFAPPKAAGLPIDGSLAADLDRFRLQNGSLVGGNAIIASDTLMVEGETFDTVRVEAKIDQPDRVDAALNIALDAKTQTAGAFVYDLKRQSYEGNLGLKADLKGDGKLRSLLSDRNLAKLLPGTTSLDWKGSGNIGEKTHRGELALEADSLSLADGAVPLDLSLAGNYSEKSADFPGFSLRSGVLDLDGSLMWKDGRLQLTEWRGISDGQQVLSLDASVPLPPDALGLEWFALEDELDLNLDISALPVATITRLARKDPPIRGNLDIDLALGGKPSALLIDGNVELGSIALPRPEGPDVPLGQLALKMNAGNDQATIDGDYDHPDLNPLSIDASLPFYPADWAEGKRKFVEEPLTVSAKMADSSLAFLSSQIPEIESIAGTIGIDATLKGSVSKPDISGRGVLDVDRLRLGDRNAPSFYDIDLATRFSDNRLTIDRLYAIVAGGEVSGSGNVQLVPGGEPKFDLKVAGREVLVFRNPDVSVRTDADISLTGPFSKARLAGEIGLVNSRYFRNFDLLPRSLPSFRGTSSALPTVERGPRGGGMAYQDLDFGVKQAPFSDWTADVRIHTKTPFQVRSNLVESDLVADLRIGGTLGNPVPNGYLAINEGEMSLPFSSVDVETGRVEFDANTGFNGSLEFKANAKADKYRINVYLYNRVLNPKYVLTSVPPMPTEDLVSLLVTGTARQDLVGEGVGTLAAGKAATLLFKNMQKASAAADKEPSLLDDLQERTELEIGGVNPETGEQTVGGKIRLWKQLFFVGDVDARNDYRAVLKYVFRFR